MNVILEIFFLQNFPKNFLYNDYIFEIYSTASHILSGVFEKYIDRMSVNTGRIWPVSYDLCRRFDRKFDFDQYLEKSR